MNRSDIYQPSKGMRVTEPDGQIYVYDGGWVLESELDARLVVRKKR